MPLNAKPAVRAVEGCKTHRRAPGGIAVALGDESPCDAAGADCLPDEDEVVDAEEVLRGPLFDSFAGRVTLDPCCSAKIK